MLEDKATKNLGASSLSASYKNCRVLVPVAELSPVFLVLLLSSFSLFQNWGNFCFQAINQNVIAALQACCTVNVQNILCWLGSIVVNFRNLCYWHPTATATTHTFGQRGFVPTAVFLQQSLI